MDKAIVQALNSLVPELSGPLPQELLDLAASLLAQSRHKASSLKENEEIARTYACADIACGRLKQSLGLPKIQPRPPCPPKVYQNLYRYLDSALNAGARRTPRKSARPPDHTTPTKASPIGSRKPTRPLPRTPTSTRNKRKREETIAEEVPLWAMPTIRHLCKQLGSPTAAPHIFSGVSSVLTLTPPDQGRAEKPDMDRLRSMRVETLIVAVFALVQPLLSGKKWGLDSYATQRDRAINIVCELRNQGEEEAEAIDPLDVNEWMVMIRKGGWCELDWYVNVGQSKTLDLEHCGGDEGEGDGDDDCDDASENSNVGPDVNAVRKKHGSRGASDETFLQAGLGTMVRSLLLTKGYNTYIGQMQDKVDYLSKERRAKYQRWKKGIMAEIERREKAQGL
ncbi:MAG: hypothetical protein Q9174_005151 [Haloplaca sp. 1 TL-2023]